MHPPRPHECAPYYQPYIDLVPLGPIVETLDAQVFRTVALLRDLPEQLASRRYDPKKWSLAEVVQHVIDTERVFGFRALWFARGDSQPLPGFEQDTWARYAPARPLSELAEDLVAVRAVTTRFLGSLDADAWDKEGTASGAPMSVRAAAYIIAGHERHHVRVIREKYL